MKPILPDGLIRPPTSGQYAFDDSVSSLTNSRILHRMWKVHNLQSALSLDNVSARSRNMLWRVWSHPGLAERITTEWLFRLLHQCERDADLAPYGPFPSWIQARIDARAVADTRARTVSISTSPNQGHLVPELEISQRNQITESSSRDYHYPGGNRSGPSQNRAQQSAGETTRPSRQQTSDMSGSTSNTTSESGSRPPLSRTTSGGRLRNIVAAAGRARARPALPRRKSSNPRAPLASDQPTSPRIPPEPSGTAFDSPESTNLPPVLAGDFCPPPGLPLPNVTASASEFKLPSASSWQSVDESATDNNSQQLANTAPIGPLQELVSRDFRGRFVENQKKIASSSNLAGLDRIKKTGSVVRFADEIPTDIRGKGKERQIVPGSEDDDYRPRSSLRGRTGSVAVDDESDSDSDSGPMLPRTKSQLSFLIKETRQNRGSRELGAQEQTGGQASKSAAREKDKNKEEELLSMGRRDGVTKAGGVQVPSTQRVSEMHKNERYESPSPPPLF